MRYAGKDSHGRQSIVVLSSVGKPEECCWHLLWTFVLPSDAHWEAATRHDALLSNVTDQLMAEAGGEDG